MRILLRPRAPVVAVLLLAPAIPELLTGSTPIARLLLDPFGFLVDFGLEVALYGGGALLIREAAVAFGKGWASILLWGAAYGIAEEGLAVHTFFERSGPPVGALTVYGSAWGVNWLWAFGLTVFHATYSIALPLLLVGLRYPEARGRRWLDSGATVLVGVAYFADVVLFAVLVPYGPRPAQLAVFLAFEALLLFLGLAAPAALLRLPHGEGRLGRWGVALTGSLEWIAWVAVLALAGSRRVSAWVAAAVLLAVDAAALGLVVRRFGDADPDRTAFAFAVGMLVPLFLWDAALEPSAPGILVVALVAAYLLYRLGRRLWRLAHAAATATPAPA